MLYNTRKPKDSVISWAPVL